VGRRGPNLRPAASVASGEHLLNVTAVVARGSCARSPMPFRGPRKPRTAEASKGKSTDGRDEACSHRTPRVGSAESNRTGGQENARSGEPAHAMRGFRPMQAALVAGADGDR
jgi:hypothetical protein